MKEKLIRIAPILLIIAIAILSIITVVTIVNAFINGGNSTPSQVQQTNSEASKEDNSASSKELLSIEQDRSVKMAVRGSIVAQENFRSYTVEVSPKFRKLTTYKGYIGEVIKEVKFENNAESYTQFVNALNKANMMKGTTFSGEADDLAGVCATGHLYDFSILKGDNVEKHLWTSTCSGSKGSLLANTKQLQNLFITQVPGNEQIVRDLGINEIKR